MDRALVVRPMHVRLRLPFALVQQLALVRLVLGSEAQSDSVLNQTLKLQKDLWCPQSREGGSCRRAFYNATVGKGVIAPHVLEQLHRLASPHKDVYEFGVYTGSRMVWIADELGMEYGQLWGFDSFLGFPAIQGGKDSAGHHWARGRDSASEALNLRDTDHLFQFLRDRIGPPRNGSTTFIQGYYSDSLTPALRTRYHFQPALLVDFDCDLYSSTLQAYHWLLHHRLIRPGTIVRYDDWPLRSAGGKPWGQALAHDEVTEQFGLNWTRLDIVRVASGTVTSSIFRLDAIGGRAAGTHAGPILE